ncbi:amyloid fiber anchoring/assembly protein TapA [Paucisalibacillus sp. EB02]|uniref:amyloid fiber anchoring/assembly protein TapA n=1 Tax=Paucisalibacillus sp. EB02 TaxID=1347087 RepID=UPI001E323EC0|nr:amyloid fiber anchoring/assembly protein TapA [Paucisalibacillus sp. EB02]
MSRLQKYKNLKKKKLVLFSKIIVAFYLVIYSFSYLTGGTIAYFSNSNQGYVSLTAGTWFDGSKLKFVGNNGTDVDQSCPTVEISADFMNVGHKMQGPTKYEVYYTEQGSNGGGSPENHGSPIYAGQIQALEKDEVITLSFVTENEGFYVFKVYQREGFEGKDKEKEIWSNKFKIQCKDDKDKNNKNEEFPEKDTVTSEKAVEESSQPEEQKNNEIGIVEEPTDEPVESDTSKQDSTKDKNNQSNEQNDNTTEDVPEKQGNTAEETSSEGATNTNNQPDGEGETNEETD